MIDRDKNKAVDSLVELESYGREHNIPILLGDSAHVLGNIIKDLRPKSVLEIGTAIGYSSLIILGNADCRLTTVEIDEDRYRMACANFKHYGVEDRVLSVKADAMDFLRDNKQKFDLIFLDGPKGQYIKYLEYLNMALNVGGTLVCDNVLFRGLVRSRENIPHRYRTIVVNLRKFISTLMTDKDYNTTIEDIGDGLLIANKVQ